MTKARDLASGGFGLVLVKPSSVVGGTDNGKGTINFTGVSSVSLNNVFSSTYDFYRIVTNIKGSTNLAVVLCMRVSNADNTTNNYRWAQQRLDVNGSTDNQWGNGVGQLNLCNTTTEFYGSQDLIVSYPFKTERTSISGTGTTLRANYTALAEVAIGGSFDLSTSFTGFSLIGSGGTITGSVQVYGFNN